MSRVDDLAAALAARMLDLADVAPSGESAALVLPEAEALARSVLLMERCLVLGRRRIAELAAGADTDPWFLPDFDPARFALALVDRQRSSDPVAAGPGSN